MRNKKLEKLEAGWKLMEFSKVKDRNEQNNKEMEYV
jgi:hypothetical protein